MLFRRFFCTMYKKLLVWDAILLCCVHSDAFIGGQAGKEEHRLQCCTTAKVASGYKVWTNQIAALLSYSRSNRSSTWTALRRNLSALNPNWQPSTSADIPGSQLIDTEENVSEKWQCWACTSQTDFLWNRQRSRMESVFTRRGEWKRFVVSAWAVFVSDFTQRGAF